MEYKEKSISPKESFHISEEEFDRNFKPKGAIAFFVLLILIGASIWYLIYYLMLQRA